MGAICSFQTLVATQQTTRRHIPENNTLHNHRRGNIKSYIIYHSSWVQCLNEFCGTWHGRSLLWMYAFVPYITLHLHCNVTWLLPTKPFLTANLVPCFNLITDSSFSVKLCDFIVKYQAISYVLLQLNCLFIRPTEKQDSKRAAHDLHMRFVHICIFSAPSWSEYLWWTGWYY
jgi:hypothetical protein